MVIGVDAPVSPCRDGRLPQLSHVTLTDRGALTGAADVVANIKKALSVRLDTSVINETFAGTIAMTKLAGGISGKLRAFSDIGIAAKALAAPPVTATAVALDGLGQATVGVRWPEPQHVPPDIVQAPTNATRPATSDGVSDLALQTAPSVGDSIVAVLLLAFYVAGSEGAIVQLTKGAVRSFVDSTVLILQLLAQLPGEPSEAAQLKQFLYLLSALITIVGAASVIFKKRRRESDDE